MRIHSKKTIFTDKHLKRDDSENSFLIETSTNNDIPLEIRQEIDAKFHQSKINLEYKFPRKLVNKKVKSRQHSQKNSFDKLNQIYQSHKASKSSNFGINIERKQDKLHSKKTSFNLNSPLAVKTEQKMDEDKSNSLSHRALGTSGIKSRSLKDKKFIEMLGKNVVPLTSKRTKSDYLSKMFSPYNSISNSIGSNVSMRLRKIYTSVKHQNLIDLSNRRV